MASDIEETKLRGCADDLKDAFFGCWCLNACITRVPCIRDLSHVLNKGHQEAISCLSSNQCRLFSGSLDRTVKGWTHTTGRNDLTLNHSHQVTCVCAVDDFVLTATREGTVHVFPAVPIGVTGRQIPEPREIASFAAHRDVVTALWAKVIKRDRDLDRFVCPEYRPLNSADGYNPEIWDLHYGMVVAWNLTQYAAEVPDQPDEEKALETWQCAQDIKQSREDLQEHHDHAWSHSVFCVVVLVRGDSVWLSPVRAGWNTPGWPEQTKSCIVPKSCVSRDNCWDSIVEVVSCAGDRTFKGCELLISGVFVQIPKLEDLRESALYTSQVRV